MIRLAIALACLAGLALAGFATLPLLVSEDEVRAALAARVRVLTGYDLAVAGDTELDLFPAVRFRLGDVELQVPGDTDGTPLAVMDAVSGSLAMVPLLIGRTAIDEVTLHRPRFVLEIGGDGGRSWLTEQGIIEMAADRPGLLPPGEIPLGEIRMEDGSILYADHRRGIERKAEAITGTVSWPHLGAGVTASGRLDWRGETTRFSFSADSPLTFLGGGETPTKFSLGSELGEASFSGKASLGRVAQLGGQLSLTSSNAGDFLRSLGADLPPSEHRHTMTLEGRLDLVGPKASLSELALVVDGNSARGGLSVDLASGKPNAQGTLAFGRLDLNTLRPLAADGDGVVGWAETAERPLDLSDLDRVSADIRISASSIAFGPLALGRTAASLTIREGRLTLGIGQTEVAGGTGIGTLTAAQKGDVTARLSLSASGVQLGELADMVWAGGRLTGSGETTLDLTGTGDTFDAVMGDLAGEAAITLSGGTIGGIDAAALVSAVGTGRLPDTGGGSTAFDRISARFSVASGIASTRNFQLQSPTLAVEAKADLDFEAATVSAQGIAEVIAGASGAEPGPAVPFIVEGPILDPLIYPDPDWLVGRGGRSVEETIDSLIERHL